MGKKLTTKDVLEICQKCPMLEETFIAGLRFNTCGKFLKKVEGKSCGCVISLKTVLHMITKCPQNKW